MKLREIIGKDEITLSFEVFPPKTDTDYAAVEKAACGVAALHPSYMSVTYGAGGSTRGNTVKIAGKLQKDYDVTSLAHLTCVGADRAGIYAALEEMNRAGIENVLALRGDIPKDFQGEIFTDYKHASDLVADIKAYGDFCVGGACYPEGHPVQANKKDDIENLKNKVDAGCEFLTDTDVFR